AAAGNRLPVDTVLQHHAVVINCEVGAEATGPVTVASLGDPLVRLLETFHLERRKPHPGCGYRLRLAEREAEAPDGEGIRRWGPLQVDVEAVIQRRQGFAIARPMTGTIR